MDNDEMTTFGGTEYADFRHQLLELEHGHTTGTGQLDSTIVADVDPLADQGGLTPEEIAELVYFDMEVSFEFESEVGEQGLATSTEARGFFGSNLPSTVDAFPATNATTNQFQVTDLVTNGTDTNVSGRSDTDDRYFELFRIEGAPPFDNPQNGYGGGQASPYWESETHYRDRYGRGPVLRSDDTLTIGSRLVCSDTVIDEGINIRMQLAWDIAETDDAERSFSVPDP